MNTFPPARVPEALHHDILSSLANRTAAMGLLINMTDAVPTDAKLYGYLTALTSMFVGLCDDHDVDPIAAFSQITDTLNRSP